MNKPNRKKIAPSILSADFTHLADEIRAVEEAGADLIHVDVMDGQFVPNFTIGPPIVAAIKKVARRPLDVHLMMVHPENYIPAFIDAGADYLTVHVETCPHLHRTVQSIRDRGIKAGVTLNPATPISAVEPILPDVDLLLVMSVNPGFGGQVFIPAIAQKIAVARQMIDRHNLPVELEVDGGIKVDNVAALVKAGADIFVAGSAIFESQDYKKTMMRMRQAMEKE